MHFKEVVIDLRRSGYNSGQIRQYIQDMYGLYLSDQRIAKICSGHIKQDRIPEYQTFGDTTTEVLMDICPREVWDSFYLPEKQYLDKAGLKKQFGFSHLDCELLRLVYNRKNKVDKFSISVREEILKADNYACRRCGYKEDRMYTYHIRPGGGDTFENGVTLCLECFQIAKKRRMVPKSERSNRKYWWHLMHRYNLHKYASKRQRYIREYGEEPR